MTRVLFTLTFLILTSVGNSDIAPNPIVLKSIMATEPYKIQMKSESVEIHLYPDSSIVSCTFNMYNHGNTIAIPVGFPEMNFLHWNINRYDISDKDMFSIYVDDTLLSKDQIHVPKELEEIYYRWMRIPLAKQEFMRLQDSIDVHYGVVRTKRGYNISSGLNQEYLKVSESISRSYEEDILIPGSLLNQFDSLTKEGVYPWYIWNVNFEANKLKTIRVEYAVPNGLGYGASYRYTNYLLSTGAGWYGSIKQADVVAYLHEISPKHVEQISPSSYLQDNNIIKWQFAELNPSQEDDIFIKYYIPSERKKFERYQKKRERQLKK